ncbi:MAG: glutamine synthetase III [Calditrichaeota bacterium]|nr:glutamine synthetase III [Calditrichota bacterium]
MTRNGAQHGFQPSELFGQNVFSLAVMRQVLPKPVYKHLLAIQESGTSLDPATADVVAAAMKDWAMARGATHYSHWFHPLHGLTAEKHQSFLIPTQDGGVITEFTGDSLLQSEPDASSFPSGGTRSTFEARGYTGWDPTSPAFLMEGRFGKTLYIPSVFLGFNGFALDKKAPLLRSIDALSKSALRVLRLFGHEVENVVTTVGCEQEYFIVDRKLYLERPDLMTCGRTLYGARPPKGQEMEDHYFGSIPERVLAFMEDLEVELYKLGIPVTTRHNEVAPGQFELAPVFERANIATDHNMLMMSVMKKVAARHDLACLTHEKPFSGINGSGKHNNWSMADDHGNNLLEPGSTPQENAQFLVFLTAVVRAIHLHGDLLRVSIATAANDHRLGANEAPPAIISVYLGDTLTEVVEAIIGGTKATKKDAGYLNIGVTSLPPLPMHDSDRNRTSPFAFTGNKFEFRAVGSGQNIARPNMVLNAIVAESLNHMTDEIEKAKKKEKDFNKAVQGVVQKELTEHQAVLFSGDNYSAEWHAEAARRGLPNLKTSVDAYPAFITKKSVKLFSTLGILSEAELKSRYHIKLDTYIKMLSIEAGLMSSMGATQILPAAMEYQRHVATSIDMVESVNSSAVLNGQRSLLEVLSQSVEKFIRMLEVLDATRANVPESEDHLKVAKYFLDKVIPAMLDLRAAGDELEVLVDDRVWPMPKYRDLLHLS